MLNKNAYSKHIDCLMRNILSFPGYFLLSHPFCNGNFSAAAMNTQCVVFIDKVHIYISLFFVTIVYIIKSKWRKPDLCCLYGHINPLPFTFLGQWTFCTSSLLTWKNSLLNISIHPLCSRKEEFAYNYRGTGRWDEKGQALLTLHHCFKTTQYYSEVFLWVSSKNLVFIVAPNIHIVLLLQCMSLWIQTRH